eukprot:GHVO01023679.1.p1 GENE.GHVO01023679.1~~GHVO01023679.1.p1  ORF type:complete len:246 (-),score=41.50 GHVO01023679.1:150-887(-)
MVDVKKLFRSYHELFLKYPPHFMVEMMAPGLMICIRTLPSLLLYIKEMSIFSLSLSLVFLAACTGPYWALPKLRYPLAVAAFHGSIMEVVATIVFRLINFTDVYRSNDSFGEAWNIFTQRLFGHRQKLFMMNWTPYLGWLSVTLYVLSLLAVETISVELHRAFMMIVYVGGHGWNGSLTYTGVVEAKEFKRVQELDVTVKGDRPASASILELWEHGNREEISDDIKQRLKETPQWARHVISKTVF